MNIKRMADEYRDQVKHTGLTLKSDIDQYLFETSYHKGITGEYRTRIKLWYNHLRVNLSKKDLKELLTVWEYLVKLSKLCEENTEDLNPKRELIFEKIQEHMNKFLEKLPRLIEKSLTRSVRESGIRLR